MGDYYDQSTYTFCIINVDIKLKSKASGLMFFDISNNTSNEVEYNNLAVIVNGVGHFVYRLYNLPLKSRGVTILAKPKLFCKFSSVRQSEYSVEKELTVHKGDTEDSTYYTGNKQLKFKDLDVGFLAFTSELLSGGSQKDIEKINRGLSYVYDKKCQLFTSTMGDEDEELSEPEFDFNVVGYIKWKDLL